jgi:hypothetical protein
MPANPSGFDYAFRGLVLPWIGTKATSGFDYAFRNLVSPGVFESTITALINTEVGAPDIPSFGEDSEWGE